MLLTARYHLRMVEAAPVNGMRSASRRTTTRVVCGVDDSGAACDAAGVAADLSAALDAQLILVHVVRWSRRSPLRPLSWAHRPELHAAHRRRAAEQAQALFTEIIDGVGLPTATETLVTIGEPAAKLAESASVLSAAMIVVGSRGHGSIRSALVGSVSSDLAAAAACPVLVVAPGSGAAFQAARDGGGAG
jgi:nucleotide-binding universal stress UspA family protein